MDDDLGAHRPDAEGALFLIRRRPRLAAHARIGGQANQERWRLDIEQALLNRYDEAGTAAS